VILLAQECTPSVSRQARRDKQKEEEKKDSSHAFFLAMERIPLP